MDDNFFMDRARQSLADLTAPPAPPVANPRPRYESPEQRALREAFPTPADAITVIERSETEVWQAGAAWRADQARLDAQNRAEVAAREAAAHAAALAAHQAEQEARHALWADLWNELPGPARARYLEARDTTAQAQADLAQAETALAAGNTPPERAADVPTWAARQAALQGEVIAYRRIAETTAAQLATAQGELTEHLRAAALARFQARQRDWEAALATWRAAHAAADAARDRAGATRKRIEDAWEAIRVQGVAALPADVLTAPRPVPARTVGPKEHK